jgi:hypothetical protein
MTYEQYDGAENFNSYDDQDGYNQGAANNNADMQYSGH